MTVLDLVNLIEITFLIGVEFILVAFFIIIFAGVVYGCVTNVKMTIDRIKNRIQKGGK